MVSALRIGALITIATLGGGIACNRTTPTTHGPDKGALPAPPATSVNLPADDGQWLMAAKDYANTRFSGLSEITPANVSNLKLAWSFSTGVLRGQEGAPLVVNNTMYLITPYPNIVYALDLSRPGAPLKWKFNPKPSAAAQGVACCDTVNRGAVYSNGRIIFNTLDANTGAELWRATLGDINRGETLTMSPLVVKGKVLVGNSGGEFGIRGWVTALNENDGTIAWRAYHTGPDKDVLIGPNFKPFYADHKGADLGVSSWPPDQWKIGGAGMWGWISYDPELDLIYYATSNPGPWNPNLRPGDNKWACTVFARRPETGEAVWAYQYNPHDLYDHDSINEHLVLDLQIDGRLRKVLVHPERNGHMYVLDRQTGEVLSAEPFGYTNTSDGVDLKTGRLKYVKAKEPATGKVIREICPAEPGAKDWQPSAYSPRTGLLYLPRQNLCQDFEATEVSYIEGTPYVGANVKMYAGPGGNRGVFSAWDPVNAKEVWSVKENFPVWSGTFATAADLVFYGTMDGWFKALNAKTGEQIWQYKVGSGIISQPMTYKGPDGRQYVAVLSGVGGWAGAIVAGDLDATDPTAAFGFANAMADLPQASTKGGTLYVFSLP